MERLTVRNSVGVAVLKDPYQCDCCGNVISRLADYGNGEPIEKLCRYEELQDRLDKEFKGCISMGTIISSFIEFYNQEEKAEELAECLLIVNDNARRYCEWEKLDKQGRLLELPCNIGDWVWVVKRYGDIDYHKVVSIEIDEDGIWLKSSKLFGKLEDFGKTIFLTREEAEEALKRMEKNVL